MGKTRNRQSHQEEHQAHPMQINKQVGKRKIKKSTPIRKSQLRSRVVQLLKSRRGQQRSVQEVKQLAERDDSWKQRLQCPICLQLMQIPTLTPCGHAFCLSCLENTLTNSQRCCICRQRVTFDQMMHSPLLENMIKSVKEGVNCEEELRSLQARQEEHEEWFEKRTQVRYSLIDDKVDFYHEGKWHEGKVTKLRPNIAVKSISSRQRQLSLQFPVQSMLLAPHRYFTTAEIKSVNIISSFQVGLTGLAAMLGLEDFLRPQNLVAIQHRDGQNGQGELRFTFHHRIEPNDSEEQDQQEQ